MADLTRTSDFQLSVNAKRLANELNEIAAEVSRRTLLKLVASTETAHINHNGIIYTHISFNFNVREK